MPGNCLTFAVRVWRQVDFISLLSSFSQLFYYCFFVAQNFVLGFEIFSNIHSQFIFRQVTNVTNTCFYLIVLTKNLTDRLGFGWRFDDDEGLGHAACCPFLAP